MGFLARLFGKIDKKVNIAMCGLDNAGKTSILHFLRKGEFSEPIATMGINHESFKLGSLSMDVMDLGGQEVFRQFWSGYIQQADILIFVVDSTDMARLPLARDVFFNAINNYCKPKVPILVLATKQDMLNICSLSKIIQFFQLVSLYDRTIHIQRTSAKTGLGIYEAFQWIHDQLLERKPLSIKKRVPPAVLPKPT